MFCLTSGQLLQRILLYSFNAVEDHPQDTVPPFNKMILETEDLHYPVQSWRVAGYGLEPDLKILVVLVLSPLDKITQCFCAL